MRAFIFYSSGICSLLCAKFILYIFQRDNPKLSLAYSKSLRDKKLQIIAMLLLIPSSFLKEKAILFLRKHRPPYYPTFRALSLPLLLFQKMILRNYLHNSKLCLLSEVKRWRHRKKQWLNFTCLFKIERIKHKLIPNFKQLET